MINYISNLIKVGGDSLNGPRAKTISPEKWQGLNIGNKMIEVFDSVYRVSIPESIEELKKECDPDLPWAEDHFQERIGGDPTNPGGTFRDWPYYVRDEKWRDNNLFTHTYQERFWPKKAGVEFEKRPDLFGIRFPVGDYSDLVNHLAENPTSRQAYLPIWFPEDSGVVHKGRVPCTLGYLFNYRDGYLHISYYIRSCDYIRHFKNDVYLTCRLLLHTLQELKNKESSIDWSKVKPGRLKMDIESLHIFESDIYELKKRIK